VLVAHGFAGSKQLMLGYGHVLAHAGYAVMLWDFDGHGANGTRLQRYELQQNLDVALQALLEQPQVDPDRLALLGHSMGSGIVMNAGIRERVSEADRRYRFAATVAVSPTGANVTPQSPRNLQLQAGSGEGRFVSNAERLLAQAGGENTNLAAGQGRSLVVIPGVEHITILFSDGSHEAALRWLDATFSRTNGSQYVDRRMAWYGLHLLGWLVGLAAIAPLLTQPQTLVTKIAPIQRWAGLIIAPLAATAGLVVLSQRFDLQNLGGVQVGGAVGVWFLLAGLTWLGVLARLPRPTLRALGLGFCCLSSLGCLRCNGAGSLASMVADSNSAKSVVASSDRLSPLVSGLGNCSGKYWRRQTHSLVAGTERGLDWWLRVDAQIFTAIGLYVFAVAAISATDGDFVSGCGFVESSMGLRDRLCSIFWLAAGSRFSPLCLTHVRW
jgi:pimeloyl-ACP methyl ester carboxylesterase